MQSVVINGADITDWATFHQVFKEVMGFPDFYGRNMDAWIDCMSYMNDDVGMTRFRLEPGEHFVIEFHDTESFMERLPDVFEALIRCTAFVNERYVNERYIEFVGEPIILIAFRN